MRNDKLDFFLETSIELDRWKILADEHLVDASTFKQEENGFGELFTPFSKAMVVK